MKSALPSLLILGALAIGSTQPAHANDEDSVRSVVAQETAAWTAYDPAKVAALYTADAIWQNPFGVRIHSRVDLQKFLVRLFDSPGYKSAKDTSEAKIIDLRFPSPDVAVVWSDESSKGQIDDATGKPMLPRHSYYMEVLAKKSGVWKISDCIIMDQVELPK